MAIPSSVSRQERCALRGLDEDLGAASRDLTEVVTDVAETNSTTDDTVPNLARQAAYLIEVAARAPSLHNTQPWRFKVGERAIEL